MFASRVTTRSKPVTSGRLTGTVRTRGTPKSRPEPAYSLYSTDPEDQVATLHKGLDRCAALLSDILQTDSTGAVPKQDRAVRDGAAKCRPHTPTGKKAIRRSVTKSVLNPRGAPMARRKSSSKPTPGSPQCSAATPHSGVKLHPPARRHYLHKTPSKSSSPGPRCPAEPLTALDCVPVRDQGPGGGVAGEGGPKTEGKAARAQQLLKELKILMSGHGESAQTYLCLLEQTVSSTLNTNGTKTQSTNKNETDGTEEPESLQSQNSQLQRQVTELNQQLQDQEATQKLLNSQVVSLQEQVRASEEELTQVQKGLRETHSRLQRTEGENLRLKTELESTRGRLRATLQDKFKLEGTVQQKQQEIEELQRTINEYDSSTPTPDDHPVYPPGAAREHITRYLLTLEHNKPTLPGESPADQPLGPSLQAPERDAGSAVSDWSVQSESTFNTRDEAAFRDGLAALDASIASLQKTLKMDLVKT